VSKKITLWALAAIVLLIFAPWSEAAFQLKKIGTRNAFYQPDLKSQADVVNMLKVNRDAIQIILTKVGWTGNIDDLIHAAEAGSIGETTIAPGTQIPYMGMRRTHRAPDVVRNVVWAGKSPFETFYIDFESAGSGWRFYAPKICSNFWIEERTIEKPAPPPEAPPPPPPPPAPTPAPEAPPPPAVEAPPAPEEGIFFIAGLVGKQRRLEGTGIFQHGDCDTLFGVKAGVLPRIGEHGEAELSVGLKFEVNDDNNDDILINEHGKKTTVFIDAALHARFNSGFVGGGISFFDLNDKLLRTAALLGQVGFGHKVGLLIEGRLPFKDFDVKNNYQLWAGIRIRP